MKKFLLKTSTSLLIVISIHTLTGAFFADGKTDAFYLRFTSPKQTSLIIGTSRAAQALQPKYLNDILKESPFELPLYNFAFTIAHSSFGPDYLNAIKKKLDLNTRNGLFIVAVDPWATSTKSKNSKDSALLFKETRIKFWNVNFINMPVNYEYLIKRYKKGWGALILESLRNKRGILRSDGWLEVDRPLNRKKFARKAKKKIFKYRRNTRVFSKTRFQYLRETLDLLNKHGSVYMVRLPVGQQMKELADERFPDFDNLIVDLSEEYNIPYLNFKNDFLDYQTTDGNHLYISSGAKISQIIARKIKEHKRSNNGID